MTLDEIALRHGTDKASSHHDYCRVYEPLFAPLRDKSIALLEIGVQFGFSIRTWLDYFHNGEIYGVDVIDQFKNEDPRFHFVRGDIGDVVFWFSHQWPLLDIAIDDGPHLFETSVVAFDCLWPKIKSGGCYIIEDLPCWLDDDYQARCGGKNPERGLLITGWIRRLIGNLNQNGKTYFGKPSPHETPTGMETQIAFVHFHRGLIIIGKK